MSNLEAVKKELSSGGVVIIGVTSGSVSNNKKYDFQCKNGHSWSGRLDNVLRGITRDSKGCPECAKNLLDKFSKDKA